VYRRNFIAIKFWTIPLPKIRSKRLHNLDHATTVADINATENKNVHVYKISMKTILKT